MDKMNIKNKFRLFDELWTPKIVGELNGNCIKIFKAIHRQLQNLEIRQGNTLKFEPGEAGVETAQLE